MACSLTDPGGCLADLAGSAASSIANSAFNEIAKDFGHAADAAVSWLWGQISQATAISLNGPAMAKDLGLVSAVAVVVATGLFVLQVVTSALRHDPGGLVRALRGLLVAFVGSVAAIALTTLLLAATDALSAGFVRAATGDSIRQLGSAVLKTTAVAQAGNAAVVLVLSLVVLGAVIVVWGAMMIRKLLVIVAAVFAPLAFAGATADLSTSWVRRWIETMVALIAAKLVLVIIFVIGLGVLTGGLGEQRGAGGPAASQSITQTIIGALILLLGGFAPWLAIKLVHFGGDHFERLHAQVGASTTGAQRVAAAPQKAMALASRFGAVSGGARLSGGGGTAGAAVAPSGARPGTTPGGSSAPRPASAPAGGGTPSDTNGTRSSTTGRGGPARSDSVPAPGGVAGAPASRDTADVGSHDAASAPESRRDVPTKAGPPPSSRPAPRTS